MKALFAAVCFAASWPNGAAAQAPSIESTEDGGVSITIAAGSQLRLVTAGGDDNAAESDNSAIVTHDVMLGYLEDMKQQMAGMRTELADAQAEIKALRADAVTAADVTAVVKPAFDGVQVIQEKLDESKAVATQERYVDTVAAVGTIQYNTIQHNTHPFHFRFAQPSKY